MGLKLLVFFKSVKIVIKTPGTSDLVKIMYNIWYLLLEKYY